MPTTIGQGIFIKTLMAFCQSDEADSLVDQYFKDLTDDSEKTLFLVTRSLPREGVAHNLPRPQRHL